MAAHSASAEALWTTDGARAQNVSDAWSQDLPPLSLLLRHLAKLLLEAERLPCA